MAMTPDEMIEVIRGWKDGKPIQRRRIGHQVGERWEDFRSGDILNFGEWEFRIKPEPKKSREWALVVNDAGEIVGGCAWGPDSVIACPTSPAQQRFHVVHVAEVL